MIKFLLNLKIEGVNLNAEFMIDLLKSDFFKASNYDINTFEKIIYNSRYTSEKTYKFYTIQ